MHFQTILLLPVGGMDFVLDGKGFECYGADMKEDQMFFSMGVLYFITKRFSVVAGMTQV